jgi:Permease for cytosine/purines, uracil, thiamine, allantoin
MSYYPYCTSRVLVQGPTRCASTGHQSDPITCPLNPVSNVPCCDNECGDSKKCTISRPRASAAEPRSCHDPQAPAFRCFPSYLIDELHKRPGSGVPSSHPAPSPPPAFLLCRALLHSSLSTFTMGRSSFSGWSRLFRPSVWKLEPEPSTFAPSSAWSNKDMDPVPVNMRTWTTFNYVTYWISDSANVAMWSLASSMLAVGLSWYEILYPVPCP